MKLSMRKPIVWLWILGGGLVALAALWHLTHRLRELDAPVSPLSYQEIEAVVSGERDLTRAQQQEFVSNLRGTKVRWTGVVEEVDEENTVFVDLDGMLYDVRFPLPRAEAVRLNRGQEITFVGLVDQVEEYFWSCRVVLRDVTIEH